jgi:hypothetical protein
MYHGEEALNKARDTCRHSMRISLKRRSTLGLLAILPLMVGLGPGCFTDKPVAGFRIAVTDFAKDPSHNYVFFSSNDAANLDTPAVDSLGDPTVHGGAIDLYNPTTGQEDVYNLPVENWMPLPAPQEGYGYLDVQHEKGPCEYVAVITGKRLVASCRGADVHFMLDEPQQGTLNFSLTLGTVGGTRYCAVFGGHVMRNISTAEADVGTFLAVDAPAPGNCLGL